MSFQYYSEPIIPPPPPPGVQSVNDNGLGVVFVDNTDPLNPIVGFSGVATDATLTGNGTFALPLSVVPPNISVNIGRTLYVSTLGNNATAVPYDIRKHYATIPAALTAAVAGDTIVVFPGTYNINIINVPQANLIKTGVNYYFMPGSIVNEISNAGASLFTISNNQNIHIKGHGIFTSLHTIFTVNGGTLSFDGHQCTTGGTILYQTGGDVNFNCDNISSDGISIAIYCTQNAKTVVNVKEYIRAYNRCLQFEQNCNVIVNCPNIYNNGIHNVYNTNGAMIIGLNLTTGKVIVNCDLMYSVNGNMVLIKSARINDGGSFIGNIKRLVNNFAAGTTHTILIADKCNYFQFNGNIYSNKAGQNIGLYYLNTNVLNLAYIEFNGNIYNNTNYALLIGYGCTFNFKGDIYGNPDATIAATPIVGLGAMVRLIPGPNGAPLSYVTFISCLIYNKSTDSCFIYKDMQLDGGGLEQNVPCNMLDCNVYFLYDYLIICEGLSLVNPNEYVTSQCVSNVGFGGNAIDATGLLFTYPKFILQNAPIAD